MVIEIENNKYHGEPSLVFNVDNYKIYVKTWSELFAEFELKHNFLNEKLSLQRDKFQREFSDADEIVAKQNQNTAIQIKEMDRI